MAGSSHDSARRNNLILAICVAAAVACLPLVVKDVYIQNMLVLTLMYAALSQSWNILSGYCGQISLGHALYFGLGAYATLLLFTKFGVLPWFGMIAGGVIAAAVAAAVGYPCFRLKGHYFVIATIVIAEAGLLLMLNWDWAGAAMGIEVPVRGDSWAKFQFARSKLPYVYFALGLALVAWIVTWKIEDSRWGYWWRAVKDNAEAAESLGVVVALLNLVWVPIVAFADIAIPDKILTLPIIAAFVVSLMHFLTLYKLRVSIKGGQMFGAMIAAMSVQWTVSRAVANGLITEHLPFARTSKGGLSRMSIEFQAFWEAVIGVLLLLGAVVLVASNSFRQITEIYIFAGVLVLQSLPFLSAVALATLELSRINSFAFWRHARTRSAELIGLRPAPMPSIGAQQQVRSEAPRQN